MDFSLAYVIAGLIVGFIVGMTGVGGGSLMTPILLYFGIPPTTAVGTDLLYAAITKGNGVFVHQKKNNINWKITGYLALGSLPAAVITLIAVRHLQFKAGTADHLITSMLGIALLLTATAILFKRALLMWSHRHDVFVTRLTESRRYQLTALVGVLLGSLVTLSSIGAGAIGTMALFLIFPRLSTSRLVGTEIAHAVPLTLIAGLGHAGLGNVNWPLLVNLLLGSLPGIWIGSHMTGVLPEKVMRPTLSLVLVYAGITLLTR